MRSLIHRLVALGLVLVGCNADTEGSSLVQGRPPAAPATTATEPPASGHAEAGGASSSAPSGSAPATTGKTDLFFKTFGNAKGQPIIFVHGGPGANGFGFEMSVAESLAARGFFVVSYDQRGGGRSPKGTTADYSYRRSTEDLDDLIRALGLTRPILLPSSFGGGISLKYVDAHPGVVKAIILVDSSINNPQTYMTILDHAADVYRHRLQLEKASDMATLKAKMFPKGLVPPFTYDGEDIHGVIDAMNTARLMYPDSLPNVDYLSATLKTLSDADRKLALGVNPDVGTGYQINDSAGYLDFTPLLQKHKDMVFGIYGAEDKIFEETQLAMIRTTITAAHFTSLPKAAHFPFMDRTDDFVEALVGHVATMH